jgi:hypothetical protein
VTETVSAADLAGRLRARGIRCDERLARGFLEEWKRRGIVEEPFPGVWRLTESGRATFGGWIVGLDDDPVVELVA